jgi:hypothetical protein
MQLAGYAMKTISRYVVFLAITVFVGSTAAGDKVVVVPLIDDASSTHSTLFLKSNGQKIGVLVKTEDLRSGSYAVYSGLSFNEYHFSVRRQSGRLKDDDLFFTTSDCTGQAYSKMGESPDDLGPFTESQGRVFSSVPGYSVPAYYVPRGTSTEVKTVKSRWTDASQPFVGECISTDEQIAVYAVLPNDPAVTGVKDNFQLPINAGF